MNIPIFSFFTGVNDNFFMLGIVTLFVCIKRICIETMPLVPYYICE